MFHFDAEFFHVNRADGVGEFSKAWQIEESAVVSLRAQAHASQRADDPLPGAAQGAKMKAGGLRHGPGLVHRQDLARRAISKLHDRARNRAGRADADARIGSCLLYTSDAA